jgi:hypothetical protein
MLSVRDPIRRRQPIERPLDIVGLELLVTVSQSLLAGILLSVAAQLGGDARAYGLPVPGLLAVLAIAVGAGWLRWLVGGSGWVMASVSLATGILTGALWLLALQDESLPRLDPLVGLLAAACAIYGLIAGVFLEGPHRAHWKGGVSQPRRGVPQTRPTPARFSPPVQKVVDERLSNVHMPQVSLPAARLSLPTVKRPTRTAGPAPGDAAGDGLGLAAAVAPHATGTAEPASLASPVARPEPPAAVVEAATSVATVAPVAQAPDIGSGSTETPPLPGPTAAEAPSVPASKPAPPVDPGPVAGDLEATEVVEQVPTDSPSPLHGADGETTSADPDAPTQPVARPAPQWPRPIEPRGHTGAHKVDPDT